MKEVPSDVWAAVRDKWRGVLKTGWHCDIWTRCALCNWINFECNKCPINPDWCTGLEPSSRLNINYTDRLPSDTWMVDVEDFLSYIEPYCDHETDKHNLNWY